MPKPSRSSAYERDGPHDDDRDHHVGRGSLDRRVDDEVGWGNAGGRTPDRRGRRSPGAVARAGESHDHSGNTPVGGRSLRGDVGLLERRWCTHHRDNNHGGGVDRLGDRDIHDPELRMRGLLVRDHLDNRSDHLRGVHLSGLTRPGGSPLSDHLESVDHHFACLDTGSTRRGPFVDWVVDPTRRALRRRQRGAQARAGVAGGPCGPKWVGAELPSALVRHSSYGEDMPGRGKVHLWKAIGGGHVLLVDAGWWKADHR